jgi:glycosyltransferase involved in cell wall biosynthesis
MSGPGVLVAQRGARHRYAIPDIFEQIGLLGNFYTDSHSAGLLAKFASKLHSVGLGNAKFERISKRIVSNVPMNKIFDCDSAIFFDEAIKKINKNNILGLDDWRAKYWATVAPDKIFKDVNFLYCQSLEGRYLMSRAKRHNIKTIVDFYGNPSAIRLVRDEKKYRGIELSGYENYVDEYEEIAKKVIQEASHVLCPSQWVAEGVRRMCSSADLEKIHIVPYGSSIGVGGGNKNRGMTVLWVGGSWFWKGLDVAVAAVGKLNKVRGGGFKLVVAGMDSNEVPRDLQCDFVEYLGKVSKEVLTYHYDTAGILLMPSISEGLSGVAIEALSRGCPIMVSRECGVDEIIDGESGYIINRVDVDAILNRLDDYFSVTSTMPIMSSISREISEYYCVNSWRDRINGFMQKVI